MNHLNQVSINKAAALVEKFVVCKKPVCLMGPPGVGKSSIIQQIAQKLKMEFLDIRLSQMDPTDLRGLLFPNKETGKADWFSPSMLPSDPNWAGVIILDEIFSAPPLIQAAAYQLVLDRKLGEYTLPPGAAIVLAGNGSSDKGLFFKMLSPLANRMAHLTIVPDFQEWKSWALQGNVKPLIVGFLEVYRNRFHEFDAQSKENAFPTGRSWKALSDMLDDDMDEETFSILSSSWVGSPATLDLLAFREIASESVRAEEILSSSGNYEIPRDKGATFAIQAGLIAACREQSNKGKLKLPLMRFVTKVLNLHGEAMATSFFQEYSRYASVTNFSDPDADPEAKSLYREFVRSVKPLVQESTKR